MNWIQGVKHAMTSVPIFKNIWKSDQIQREALAHCEVCDVAISHVEYQFKEIVFACRPGRCLCSGPLTSQFKSHAVCEVCDAMYRALYVNYKLKDMNYFKSLDEKAGREDR